MSTALCRESLCRTRGWGARVQEKLYGIMSEEPMHTACPDFLHCKRIICNKNSNQSNISSRKNTYKTWMHHHNFGLATSTSEELAVTSYLHPDGTFILLATLFLMDLKRKPTQAMWLQFRTCFHLESLTEYRKMYKNGEKWKNRATSRQPS